jgi:predicted DNA-binding transcriptional regulator YafY
MPEVPQLERLLRMIISLSGPKKFTADEITERFDISRRTFYRDQQTLLNAGFAFEQDHGLYWIEKIASPFKQLHELPYFTEEEAWIMRKAIHSIDENNLLKSKLVEKLYALYKFGKVAEIIVKKEQSEVISNLTKAINSRKQIVLHEYHSSHSSTIQDRLVEPFDFTSNYISVWAFDMESRSNKVFKTSRITKATITGEPFRFTSLHKSLPLDVFRISGNTQTKVKLSLSMRAYNLMIEEYPMAEKHITPLGSNRWLFDAPVSGFEGVGRFVLGLCEDVEIISPDELKTFIRKKINCLKKNLTH